jgi:UDP-arabinose 4-epimerase
MNNKILVTGGAGFIGSHVCKALAESNYYPITFDNLSRGHRWAVNWGPLEVGDINDKEALGIVIEKYNPFAVMHFAAFAYVGESVAEPKIYYRNNLIGSINLLETMLEHGILNLVFSSSCATYGIPVTEFIKENHPQNPVNPYGESKLMIERILFDYEKSYSFKSVILRYFNAAGADAEGKIGEVHTPEPHLIPLIFDVALGNRSSIEIYGDDYETRDGTCIRDFIHVCDIADAHVRALEKLESRNESGVFNLGNGKGYTLLEVIKAAERVTGIIIDYQIVERREGDPAVLVADSKHAQDHLEWNPKFKNLEKILETAWAWHQKIHLIRSKNRSG